MRRTLFNLTPCLFITLFNLSSMSNFLPPCSTSSMKKTDECEESKKASDQTSKKNWRGVSYGLLMPNVINSKRKRTGRGKK